MLESSELQAALIGALIAFVLTVAYNSYQTHSNKKGIRKLIKEDLDYQYDKLEIFKSKINEEFSDGSIVNIPAYFNVIDLTTEVYKAVPLTDLHKVYGKHFFFLAHIYNKMSKLYANPPCVEFVEYDKVMGDALYTDNEKLDYYSKRRDAIKQAKEYLERLERLQADIKYLKALRNRGFIKELKQRFTTFKTKRNKASLNPISNRLPQNY